MRGQKRRDHRDRHSDRRDLVAADRRSRPGESAQPVDEQRERDDVQRVDEVRVLQEDRGGDHRSSPPPSASSPDGGKSGLLLNIPSIRSVTKKPPTMLIVPNAIAITS